MQQTIPYRDFPTTAGSKATAAAAAEDSTDVRRVVAENAVVVFARRGCCMCHVVKLLLNGNGVNPLIFDVDEKSEADLVKELVAINGVGKCDDLKFPVVFVGGEGFGGLEEVMAAHISGELVPRLREARALWL